MKVFAKIVEGGLRKSGDSELSSNWILVRKICHHCSINSSWVNSKESTRLYRIFVDQVVTDDETKSWSIGKFSLESWSSSVHFYFLQF